MHRIPRFMIVGIVLIGTTACDRPATTEDRRTPEEKTDQAAHKVGEGAYTATRRAKEAAERTVQELKKAGREVRDGWEDAKHRDPDAQRTRK